MITGDRTSILKKKGIGANGEFQNMHLAVFPFEVQFQKNVDHKTIFYFQKKFQVIGKLARQIPPCKKGTKLPIKSLDNIIHFRLYSQNNVVYQWSAYRVNQNGEEQSQDSCSINLKDMVYNFIMPQKSIGSRSTESLINLSFGNKQFKLKFPKLGILLSMKLIVSDDPKNIIEEVEKRYFRDDQLYLPTINLLKTQSSGNIQLSSKKNNSGFIEDTKSYKRSSEEELKSSVELLKYQSKEKSDSYKERINQEMTDLDLAIFKEDREISNFDATIDDQFQQIKLQIQRIEKVENKLPEDEVEEEVRQQFASKQLQVENDYNQGILKLQSDQVQRQKEDSRLEYEQLLDAIEEAASNKQTLNYTLSPKFQTGYKSSQKTFPTTAKPKFSVKPIKQQAPQISQINEPKYSMKKIGLFIFVFVLLTIIGATVVREINNKSRRSRKK